MTRRAFSQGKTTAIAWAAGVLTVVVCGVGLRITYLQYTDVRRVILQSNRERAQRAQGPVSAHLEELEREVLGDLVHGGGDADALSRRVAAQPVIESPFFVTASGSVHNPLLPRLPAGARMTGDDPMPRDFEDALRLAWSAAPAQRKLEVLRGLGASTGLAEHWRLRVSSLIAALHAKEGRPADAASSYRKLFADFRNSVTENTRPSYLQLTLAYGESLLRTDAKDELRNALVRALDLLDRGELKTTMEEERFFLRRARSLCGRARIPPSPQLLHLEDRQERERRTIAVAAAVRTRVDSPERIAGRDPGLPRRFYEEVDRESVVAIWSVLSTPTSDGVVAAGFVANKRAFAEEATRILNGPGSSPPLVVRPRSSAGRESDAFIPLLSLGPGHEFLEICLPRAEWNQHVGRARRPFLVAGGLIGLVAVALLLCLVVMHRGVRRELMLSRMKTEFVANVSHELKTPLALIRMFSETLLLGRVSDESHKKKYYNIITRESERLSHLISNVLNFSSIEAGKKGYQLRRIGLRAVIEEVVESYRYGLEAKGFELRTELDEDLPEIEADPEAVSQALINLLENSIKYSPEEKSLQLSVKTRGRNVEVSLAYRGVGIAPEDQKRVLEDYYRTREARALGTRGSGLGLSVVQHIMEAHSGQVRLESQPGSGSRFTLVFPAAPPPRPVRGGAAPDAANTERPETEPDRSGSGAGPKNGKAIT